MIEVDELLKVILVGRATVVLRLRVGLLLLECPILSVFLTVILVQELLLELVVEVLGLRGRGLPVQGVSNAALRAWYLGRQVLAHVILLSRQIKARGAQLPIALPTHGIQGVWVGDRRLD